MNTQPCDRRAVALLAAASLPESEGLTLRRHLEECPSCRAYFDSIARIHDEHRRVRDALGDQELPDAVLHRVANTIRAESRAGRRAADTVGRHGWKMILAGGAAAALWVAASRDWLPVDVPKRVVVSRTEVGSAGEGYGVVSSRWTDLRAAFGRTFEVPDSPRLATVEITAGESNVRFRPGGRGIGVDDALD